MALATNEWAMVDCRQNRLRDEDETVRVGVGIGSRCLFHNSGHCVMFLAKVPSGSWHGG